jgi:hypothetical protein
VKDLKIPSQVLSDCSLSPLVLSSLPCFHGTINATAGLKEHRKRNGGSRN